MAPETEPKAKSTPAKKASKPEKKEVELPGVDLGKSVEHLENHVGVLEGKVAHLEARFVAFLTGLSDNFGKEWVQQFLAEE